MLAINPSESTATAAAFQPSQRKPQGWFGAFAGGEAAASRHLLLLRFAVINLVALALLGAAWLQGWVDLVLDGDSTRLVAVIGLVFAAGLLECGRKLWQTSAELDRIAAEDAPPRAPAGFRTTRGQQGEDRAVAASVLKLRLSARIAPIRHIANSLVFLGLIGTVIGFIIALSGIDPDTAGDVSAIAPMVSTLIGGMSVALYTTLVGAILNVWLMVNYRLLESGTVRLLAALVERGEGHV
jgi:MotA/TolQ/ExbB proton channel family